MIKLVAVLILLVFSLWIFSADVFAVNPVMVIKALRTIKKAKEIKTERMKINAQEQGSNSVQTETTTAGATSATPTSIVPTLEAITIEAISTTSDATVINF